ncbi:MAG: hypothetical protein COB54_02195 [Alphaproteobacteria bacterium]|nr:MAG: hypothetical protein COB54_02195 [Alphaproteobacteria bacterium]
MPRSQNNIKKKTNGKIRQKTLRRWHRWVGFTSLFFVLILSITGLILNRTEKLGLTQIRVQNEVVSTLYGLSPTTPPIHFKIKGHWMSWLEGRLYLDGALLAQNTDRLVGGALLDDLTIVGTENSLSLYMSDGALVETLDSGSLPGQITALGQSDTGDVWIDTPNGRFKATDDFMAWAPLPAAPSPSSDQTEPAPDKISEKILLDFQGQGITLSRLILDLHSGHIMGSFGPYLMDLAAISLIFLGLTGLMKRRPGDKNRRKDDKDRRKRK